MYMAKDRLLGEDFFLLHLSSDNELSFAVEELNILEQLVKQRLYPFLSTDQKPTYYQGGATLNDLNKFVYQDEKSGTHSDKFKFLQVELKLSVTHIQLWAISNKLENTETLAFFLKNLEKPSDNMSLLYGDGKLLLEKVAMLLDEPLIKLEERKKIVVNLLADKELEKCIAGCYSRIANAALQLQENLEGDFQIKQWLRSYSKITASHVAAKRPFAMPDTYQVMVCKASDSAVEQNLLHANNYLVMQAKEQGFPIEHQRDQGAIELGNGLTQLSKKAIIDLYLKDLEQQITAKNLVHYISQKLHTSFEQIVSDDIAYEEKSDRILNKLNLLGEDTWFKTNKVGLEEILTDSGQLKPVEDLYISVTQRLLARKLLKGFEAKKINLNRGGSLEYYEFNSEISLTWFWVDNQRIPLLELIKTDRLPALIPLTHLQETDRHRNIIQIIHNFIKDTESLIKVIKNLPPSYGEFFVNAQSLRRMVAFSQNSDSVKLFIKLLTHIPDKAKRSAFLTECGIAFVQKMLYQGLCKADINHMLLGLSISYLNEAYPAASKREALSVTKDLLSKLLENEFKSFSKLSFIKLPHAYLDELDFSNANFQSAKFYQPIRHCKFDFAEMEGASFSAQLEHLSFKNTDLRKVVFNSPYNTQYSDIDLENALLSTESFKGLRSAYVVNFVGANCKEVDFHDAGIKSRLQYLDFTNANLESCDLNKLKLNGVTLWEANLAKANLIGAEISKISINPHTNLEASHLDLYNVDYLYRRGIKDFSGCKIHIETSGEDPFEFYSFHHINFKKTEFIGEKLYINFIESDLSAALFRPKTVQHAASAMTLSVAFKQSQLDTTSFRHVKFTIDSIFLASTLTQLNFDHVEMPARFLFALYDAGQRDFMGIKSLKGPIPQKLVAFPVLGAKLKKDSFLHLYRQGLRDFRGSNLNSFYLSQVLTEQAISAIDLKLEGAEYKQSPLSCISGTRHKRSISIPFCTVHFLFQKTNTERKVSLTDIETFATIPQGRYSLKELVLGPKPLYILSDEVNEVNFYWGYRPDEDVFIQLDSFTKKSITAFEVSERKNINLRFHFSKIFSDVTPLSEFAGNIGQLGFSDVTLNYYNQHTQLSKIELKNGVTSITTLSVTQDQILQTDKFRALLKNVKLNTRKAYNKEDYRARLRQMTSDVRRKLGAGVRTGIRNGAQYEIGRTIIFFIGEAINNPKTSDIQLIPAENKTALKQLAYHLAQEVGQERGASERQINVTTNVAEQCIDRGECSTEEQVIRDVADSMQRIRPDLMLGNEYAWNKTQEFFVNIGSFVSDKFDELKQFFSTTQNRSVPTDANSWRPPTGVFLPRRGIQKKSLYNWYEAPLLLTLTKKIENVFDGFEVDLQQDEDFSEAKIAGFLSQLWQALASLGVNNNATEEFTLSLLKQLESTCFPETSFNSSQGACMAEFALATATELPIVTTIATRRVSPSRRRRTRAISSAEKFDFTGKKKEIDDPILELADHYLLKYESKKNYSKKHYKNQQNGNVVSPLKNQQPTSEFSNKSIDYEKNYKPDKKSDQKPNLSDKYFNNKHLKEHKHKQAFISPINFSKQPMIEIKVPIHDFKNNHQNHLGIVDMRAKKYIQVNGNYPLLQNDQSFFRATHSRMTAVTARSDLHTSLFALNFCIKCLSKEKKLSYVNNAKVPKLAKMEKMEERIIAIKRNICKLPRITI